MVAPVIGIDLGTSNTCAAVVIDGEVRTIPDERGRVVIPSVVTQNKFGRFIVGHFAKAQQITNPYETIYSVKRLIGQQFDSEELERVRRYLSYTIEKDERTGGVLIPLGDAKFTPTEISAQILMKVKETARTFLGEEPGRAVITVPAHFNDIQRKETKLAGEMAGFEVIRLINEPTASALAFGFGHDLSTRVAVFDFGGGTFDISVMNIEKNIFEVISTGGDSYLGGDDFNWAIVDHLAAQFLISDNINLKMDKMAMQRLLDAAETAKVELSDQSEVLVDLPRIAPNIDVGAHLQVTLRRSQLEAMSQEFIQRALDICSATFEVAGITPQDVDQILMVGGQTRMPAILAAAQSFFQKPCNTRINPEEAVAIGAAIQGHTLVEEHVGTLLLDVTPLTLGIGTFRDIFVPLITRNTKVPHKMTKIFTTTHDQQERVKIRVYQGESRRAPSNQLLGEFILEPIRKAPRMEPNIEVTFKLDANGILSVSAKDVDTGEETGITIEDYPELAKKMAEDYLPAGEAWADLTETQPLGKSPSLPDR